MSRSDQRARVELTHLDDPLFEGAGATKRDLVDYLDRASELILPELRGRALTVVRVHRGDRPFVQKTSRPTRQSGSRV